MSASPSLSGLNSDDRLLPVRIPVSWLREYVDLPGKVSTAELADRLTMLDLKLEEIISSGISGPLTVGRVLTLVKEPQNNGRTINWCRVDVGQAHNEPAAGDVPAGRGIVCGAHNFVEGDLVVVSLPGTVLPVLATTIPHGEITARKTYGHTSDGMICSGAELGITGDAEGIIVLDAGSAEPGDDAIELLGLREDVLDLEVNPDRAYALSLRGVARDVALGFDCLFTDPANIDPIFEAGGFPVRVDDSHGCPVFATTTVTGFDPSSPTPRWMARRIELAGMRPISLAVDVSNYVMLELGQPNHAYDRAKLNGSIIVRRARAGEQLETLDSVVRTLSADDLVIADEVKVVGLAGVMGGEDVEIDDKTTDIVIEAAHFDAPTIARAARHHKLHSEASKRFERGVDPELPSRTVRRVAELMVEHGGGTFEPGTTLVGAAPAPNAITIDSSLPTKVTGIDIDQAVAVSALEANGCAVAVEGSALTVTPPTWRPDLTDPYDLTEEVLRIVGYDKVPSVLPAAPAGRGLSNAQRLRRRTGQVLAGAGLIEVKTFPFAGPADWDKLGLAAGDGRRRQVLLENPLSAEEPGMTTTLLPGLLKALVLNTGRGHLNVSIVETGRVFLPRADAPDAPIYGVDRRPTADELAALDAALPEQPLHVGIVMAGERVRTGWYGAGRLVSWADSIEVVRLLAGALHVNISVENADEAPWHPGRCAAILLDGLVIGHAGELHPRVIKAYGVPARTVAAEFNLDALIAASPELGPKPVFSTFPVAKEDVALVVDRTVTAAAVFEALAGADDLIESARLFDVYEGEQLPAGKKSLAFSLRLRASDRTLKDEEIKAARDAAVTAAAEATGAVPRS